MAGVGLESPIGVSLDILYRASPPSDLIPGAPRHVEGDIDDHVFLPARHPAPAEFNED